ncbi:MAG: ATP-binding protein [Chthoniobacter sp.]|nr:ATP-binding protein [Chthoniobacter sp.]
MPSALAGEARNIFLAFFQPQGLEDSLKPRDGNLWPVRRRYLIEAAIVYTLLYLFIDARVRYVLAAESFASMSRPGMLIALSLVLLPAVSCSAVAIWFSSIFQRDSLASLIIGFYWSCILSLGLGLWVPYMIRADFSNSGAYTPCILAGVFIFLSCLAALMVTIRRSMAAISTIAAVIAFISLLAWTVHGLFGGFDTVDETCYYVRCSHGGKHHEVVVAAGRPVCLAWNSFLLYPTKDTKYTCYVFEPQPGGRVHYLTEFQTNAGAGDVSQVKPTDIDESKKTVIGHPALQREVLREKGYEVADGTKQEFWSFESWITDWDRCMRAPLLFAFYTGLGLMLCLPGSYRLPFYFGELLWHGYLLADVAVRDRLRFSGAALPIVFDEVSSLPFPCSKWILHQIAKTDPHTANSLAIRLTHNRNRRRVGAATFIELHTASKGEFFSVLFAQPNVHQFARKLTADQLYPHNPLTRFLRAMARASDWSATYDSQGELDTGMRALADGEFGAALRALVDSGYEAGQPYLALYTALAARLRDRALRHISAARPEFDHCVATLRSLPTATATLTNLAINLQKICRALETWTRVNSHRDRQFYLLQAWLMINNVRNDADELHCRPLQDLLRRVLDIWTGLITREESLALMGRAELELQFDTKRTEPRDQCFTMGVTLRNIGEIPAEKVAIEFIRMANVECRPELLEFPVIPTNEERPLTFEFRFWGRPTEIRTGFVVRFEDAHGEKTFRSAQYIVIDDLHQGYDPVANPYVVGVPLQESNVFFGRDQTMRFIMDSVQAGRQNNVLILHGQRRIGKSSVLYQISNTPLVERYVPVLIDCQSFGLSDTNGVCLIMCVAIEAALNKRHLEIKGAAAWAPDRDWAYNIDRFFDEVAAKLHPQQLLLMIDEYDVLEERVKKRLLSPEFFHKLRNLIQHRNEQVAFIFVGTRVIQEMTANYWSFLFNTAMHHEIAEIDEEQARILIEQPVAPALRYDPLAVAKILRATGRHPYFIQMLGQLLVSHCNNNESSYITLADVNLVLEAAVQSSSSHVKYLATEYASEDERPLLCLLARLTDDAKPTVTLAEIAQFAEMSKWTGWEEDRIAILINSLQHKRLVHFDGNDGPHGKPSGIHLQNEFLRLWLRQHAVIEGQTFKII